MLRALLAAVGSAFALIGAVVAVAIVGAAVVVFDRWPAADDGTPAGSMPLAAGATTGTRAEPGSTFPATFDAAVRGALAAAAGAARRPTGAAVVDAAAEPRALTTTPAGAPGSTGTRPVTGAGGPNGVTTPGVTTGLAPKEQLAGAVDGAGGSAGDGTRSGGAAAGEAVGTVHPPTGASTTTSADATATGMQQAAVVVAEALRRLPPG